VDAKSVEPADIAGGDGGVVSAGDRRDLGVETAHRTPRSSADGQDVAEVGRRPQVERQHLAGMVGEDPCCSLRQRGATASEWESSDTRADLCNSHRGDRNP